MTDPAGRNREVHLGIDVGAMMREALASTHANLVTRPTGRAVREAIERRIVRDPPPVAVALIDLTRIRVLDFSCADEVVAGLLLRYLEPDRPHDAFFLFRAIEEVHGHAVGEVLARHGLAAVGTFGRDRFRLLGTVSREEREAWSVLERHGSIAPDRSESLLGARGAALLRRLSRRRLAFRHPAGVATALSALSHTLRERTSAHPSHPGEHHGP